MNNMDQNELRKYLGQEIIDMFVQWYPEKEAFLTKKRMINLINLIHGKTLFKNKDFRKNLLQCMKPSDILYIKDKCLKNNKQKCDNLSSLIDIIANTPWKKNQVSSLLAELWELPNSTFDKRKVDDIVESTIVAPEDPFYELLDYQYYIKQRALNNLNSNYMLERMLIHMPTGTGKTKTAMHIVANYINFTLRKQGVVLWVAHTNELLRQAYDTFLNVWSHIGIGDIKAYSLWGNKTIPYTDEPLNGIIFCGLAKLMSIQDSNQDLYQRIKEDCRLIVFDEAHKAGATQTKKIIEDIMTLSEGFENRALIGLTATPGRTTEDSYDNRLLSSMFGNKLIHINSDILNQVNYGKLQALNTIAESNIIRYFQERRILAKMQLERLTYQKNFSKSELEILNKVIKDIGYDENEYSDEQLKILACNRERNLEIIKRIKLLHIEKIPTIVFACSVNHAKILSAMLSLEEIPNSLILGEMDPIDRNSAINDFKNKNSNVNIIINYEVLTTGFDSKNIRCVFITRPTKSIVLYSQMLGRGLRGPLMGGNEECLLIDVDDNLDSFDNGKAFSYFNDYWRI